MAGFTVKGLAMQVAPDHAGRVCDSPQLPLRQPSPSMSPITVGCLPEFMPSPLDLDDKPGGGMREKSPLEIVRRDITAAGSNLGKQLAECVASFDANGADEVCLLSVPSSCLIDSSKQPRPTDILSQRVGRRTIRTTWRGQT